MSQGTQVRVIESEPIYHGQFGVVECGTPDFWLLVRIGDKLRSFRETELEEVKVA